MCGRFVRSSPAEDVTADFGVTSSAAVDLRPRFNVCPGEPVAAIVHSPEGPRLGAIRWGLGSRGQINVRTETTLARPALREALRRRRCLVVADGFYEWRREGSARVPHFFRLASHRPFALAGIWERGRKDGAPEAAILTCPPNELVGPVHDRMPVLLDAESARRWLEHGGEDDATALLRPFPAAGMEGYEVSPLVNSVRNDSAECIRPATADTSRLVPRAD